jgi:hypothetical protein
VFLPVHEPNRTVDPTAATPPSTLMKTVIFMASLLVGFICLTTAILDWSGNAEWAPIGFMFALIAFLVAWMTFP